jgi:transposase
LSRLGTLKVFTTQQTIDSDFIIECVDEIAEKITRPTVLVFDNAPWHRSKKVILMREKWEKRGLYLFFLPIYSAHLNLIEILWRKIKYEWLKPVHYESPQTLKNAIYHIIKKYDNEFCIKFSKNFNL